MRVGPIRIKLSEQIFDRLRIDVRPEELYVIPNGGSNVYDPPRWEGHGRRSPSGTEVRVFSWDRMRDVVKKGISPDVMDEGYEVEIGAA